MAWRQHSVLSAYMTHRHSEARAGTSVMLLVYFEYLQMLCAHVDGRLALLHSGPELQYTITRKLSYAPWKDSPVLYFQQMSISAHHQPKVHLSGLY